MLARMIDDLKESTGTAVRTTSLAAMIVVALFVTVSFLTAAAFIYVLQNFGLIEACLTGAGIFLVLALIGVTVYAVRKQRARQHAEQLARETTKSALQTALADPAMMAIGVQLIRAIGVKKLVPLLAVGGLALGLLAGLRAPSTTQAPAE
jgi:hypothetical protein